MLNYNKEKKNFKILGLLVLIVLSFTFSTVELVDMKTENFAAVGIIQPTFMQRIRAFFAPNSASNLEKVAPGSSSQVVNTLQQVGSGCNDKLACNFDKNAPAGEMGIRVVCKYEKINAINLADKDSVKKRTQIKPENVDGYEGFTPPKASNQAQLAPSKNRQAPVVQSPASPMGTKTYDVGGVAWSVREGTMISWNQYWLGSQQLTEAQVNGYMNSSSCGSEALTKTADATVSGGLKPEAVIKK